MATDALPRNTTLAAQDRLAHSLTLRVALVRLLTPLASLKLTVVLFALAMVLVFVGTLAQWRKDIWVVVNEYFRSPFAYVEWYDLTPKSFFPDLEPLTGGFWFPGGWLIGGAMAVNLLAAHGLRFKVQASGRRLAAGLGVIALGIALTWLVIVTQQDTESLQGLSASNWKSVWIAIELGLAALWGACAYRLLRGPVLAPWQRWALVLAGLASGALCCWLVFLTLRGDAPPLGNESMRILWQLIKATAAGCVLLAGCVLVFRKRAGIVLLHGGLGLMMANELIVHRLHTESMMQIHEGQTVNVAQDIRTIEIAVVDASDPKFTDVVAVPRSILLGNLGAPIQHADLPFDITVENFIRNAELLDRQPLQPGSKPPPSPPVAPTAGAGLELTAVESPPSAGADTSGRVDTPAAFVRLTGRGGQDLGVRLLSVVLKPEKIDVGGKTYELALRFKQIPKPYSIKLHDFRKDDYVGTDTVKNFSSDVQLIDPSRNVDREVHIWMNNPLRYGGDTLYQADYDKVAGKYTVLQVVSNAGWMIPYVGCMIVAVGMLAQFGLTLARFLRRQSTPELAAVDAGASSSSSAQSTSAKIQSAKNHSAPRRRDRQPDPTTPAPRAWLHWLVPAAFVAVAAACFAYQARQKPVPEGEFDLVAFGKLPVVYEGRVKPLDTVARNALRVISDRESFVDTLGTEDPKDDVTRPAIRWLFDLMINFDAAAQYRVVRIDNLELLDTLGLPRRKGFKYALGEFQDQMPKFRQQLALASEAPKDKLTTNQRKVLELAKRLNLYFTLAGVFQAPDIVQEKDPEKIKQALQAQATAERDGKLPLIVPAEAPSARDTQSASGKRAAGLLDEPRWQSYGLGFARAFIGKRFLQIEPGQAIQSLSSIVVAADKNDPATFNKEVAFYQNWLNGRAIVEYHPERTSFEAFFNRLQPFFLSQWSYFVVFVLACGSWLAWRNTLGRAALWLLLFTLAAHSFALVSRMYISGRPPVTNLYSASVFIGWGAVLMAAGFELIFRSGIGSAAAAMAGFLSLLVADKLAGDGDTFIVLQAVLDTQFWLATHVVCVTMGYAATFLAGALGIIYIVRGALTPSLSVELGKQLSRMIYGTLCFAIFFSFVGTVLGGLWADDSWGRFWGWDPKENGALLIVLWNALVLHARWGGMVKDQGMAVLSLGGNIVTAWSMFGVNELGIGLHSYGFTEGVLWWLSVTAIAQLVLMAVGVVPQRYWLSFRPRPAATA